MVLHQTGVPVYLEPKHENVAEGDAVFIDRKGKVMECAVMKRQGERVRLQPEDKSGDFWVACAELQKVVAGGAEELMSRAARIAAQKAKEEADRKKEADRKAAVKAEKDGYEKAATDRAKAIEAKYLKRAVPSRDWCPMGTYNWTESPVLMDQTKDCYRIVWYEINTDFDYGAHHSSPELDLSEVEAMKEEFVVRDKAAAEEKKAKAKQKGKKKSKEELEAEKEAEEAAIKKQAEDDEEAIARATRKAEEKLAELLDNFDGVEKARVITKPPKYSPEKPCVLEPPSAPGPGFTEYDKDNMKLYEKLLEEGHAGDRVFYTDGTVHNVPYVVGSKDGVLKGGGLSKEVVESFEFEERIVTFTPAFDGGITLTKHDCFPKEDPATWIQKSGPLWSGDFRADQEGEDTEDW